MAIEPRTPVDYEPSPPQRPFTISGKWLVALLIIVIVFLVALILLLMGFGLLFMARP